VTDRSSQALAHLIAEEARRRGLKIAVAESLTGGLVSSALAAAPDASDWLAGGLVAYSVEAKQQLLGVSPGPVVNEQTVREMAEGAARLFGADATVATTGVGGPGPTEGKEPGTVWLGAFHQGEVQTRCLDTDGDPEDVCRYSVEAALTLLLEQLGVPAPSG
jgi:nicotinamide-nucleotide amidase